MMTYAVTNLGTKLVDSSGRTMRFRFRVRGEQVVVSNHVQTYQWFHPLTQTVDIHEATTGACLASHREPYIGKRMVEEMFRAMKPEVFFESLRQIGPHHLLIEISFDDAMARIREHMKATRGQKREDPFLPPGHMKVYCPHHEKVHFVKETAKPCSIQGWQILT